ncbi:hypothetical protein [Epilithonimonas sp.]|uniref:hypothetical protein n=1 Tax=Epilithonimonas sp. TaxID=2894511 RepID=UPI00289FB3DA|nr:hypothetical protein [Epilithonimonas sp.]
MIKKFDVSWIDKNKDGKIDENEKDSMKPYTEVTVIGNKAIISFQIEETLSNYFNEFDELELFMSVSCDDETLELPENEIEFFDVKPLSEVVKEIYVRLLQLQGRLLKIIQAPSRSTIKS